MKKLWIKSIVAIWIAWIVVWFLVGFFVNEYLIKNQDKPTIISLDNEVLKEDVNENTNEEEIKKEEVKEDMKNEVLADADIRNVKRWMSKEEVKKYEWIEEDNILEEKDKWDESILNTEWKFDNRTAYVNYFFNQDRLYDVIILIENAKPTYYQSMLNSLNKKYWDWSELSMFDDVDIWSSLADKRDIQSRIDVYITLWYLVLSHEWQKGDTKVSIVCANWDILDMPSWDYILVRFFSQSIFEEVESHKEAISDI